MSDISITRVSLYFTDMKTGQPAGVKKEYKNDCRASLKNKIAVLARKNKAKEYIGTWAVLYKENEKTGFKKIYSGEFEKK